MNNLGAERRERLTSFRNCLCAVWRAIYGEEEYSGREHLESQVKNHDIVKALLQS
jgi:hypothetical protein